jgi:hypothetical protein
MHADDSKSLSGNDIGDTPPRGVAQEDSCNALIPVAVPKALKALVIARVGKGKVSPYVRALIERDLAA